MTIMIGFYYIIIIIIIIALKITADVFVEMGDRIQHGVVGKQLACVDSCLCLSAVFHPLFFPSSLVLIG